MRTLSNSTQQILFDSAIFKNISRESLEHLVDEKDIFTYNPNHTILDHTQLNCNLFIILSGKIRLYLATSRNLVGIGEDNIEIAVLEKGASFGEYSFLCEQPVIANAETLEHTKILIITYPKIEAFSKTDPRFGKIFYYNLLKIVTSRARQNNTQRGALSIWDLNYCR